MKLKLRICQICAGTFAASYNHCHYCGAMPIVVGYTDERRPIIRHYDFGVRPPVQIVRARQSDLGAALERLL